MHIIPIVQQTNKIILKQLILVYLIFKSSYKLLLFDFHSNRLVSYLVFSAFGDNIFETRVIRKQLLDLSL